MEKGQKRFLELPFVRFDRSRKLGQQKWIGQLNGDRNNFWSILRPQIWAEEMVEKIEAKNCGFLHIKKTRFRIIFVLDVEWDVFALSKARTHDVWLTRPHKIPRKFNSRLYLLKISKYVNDSLGKIFNRFDGFGDYLAADNLTQTLLLNITETKWHN